MRKWETLTETKTIIKSKMIMTPVMVTAKESSGFVLLIKMDVMTVTKAIPIILINSILFYPK